tara:strand:+ start:15 stop:233 length:219 start_codon:yes stop_codon:yes gene_type:complete
MAIARETQEKGYDYCVVVIWSCETKEQLKNAKNLVEIFRTNHGPQSMGDYMKLMNHLLNQEMRINYEAKDSE